MKRLNKVIFILIMMFIATNVKAAGTANISISPSSKTVIAGNKFTVNVTVSASEPMAGLSYTIDYNSGILALESTDASTGGARNLDAFMNNTTTSVTYSYTFRARTSGKSTISIVGAEVRNSTNALSVSTGTSSITVMTQQEVYATYSSNNNLSSLSIDGYELTPAFDKNTLEYSVKLKPETEKINVSATKEDGTATINGIGEVLVSEGKNQIRIEVVAQNGNIKTYVINAEVTDYDPIDAYVDGKKYSVVRSEKAQTLTNSLFVHKKINIDGNEVPAFYNEITDTTLVALKDEDGNVSYFVYKDNKYYPFRELKRGNTDLIISELKDLDGYIKTKVTINEVEYDVYKVSESSRFSILYGTNLTNNNTAFYVYDNFEDTLQRYDDEMIKKYVGEKEQTMNIIYILGATSLGLLILLIASLVLNRPKKEKVKKPNLDDTSRIDIAMVNNIDNIDKAIEKTKKKKK